MAFTIIWFSMTWRCVCFHRGVYIERIAHAQKLHEIDAICSPLVAQMLTCVDVGHTSIVLSFFKLESS
eukprot:522494-Prymnesium_polylepis.1